MYTILLEKDCKIWTEYKCITYKKPVSIYDTHIKYGWLRLFICLSCTIRVVFLLFIAAGSMTEAESMESLSSSASLVQHNLRGEVQAARSHTLSQARTNCGQTAAASPSQSPRLNRSNSIRYE